MSGLSSSKPWALNSDKILHELEVSKEEGLGEQEAKRRKEKYGKNLLRKTKKRSRWAILADQFKSILIVLLLVATAIALVFGETTQAIAISVLLAINTAIGFFTEVGAAKSVEALRKLGQVKTRVRRNGQVKEIHAEDVTIGDIVLVEAGDVVTADVRLLEASKLELDESTLTGESVPVGKKADALHEHTPLAERSNMLFKGTATTRGSGEGVIVSIGMDTELGKITSLVEDVEEKETPLERRLESFGRKMVLVTCIIVVIVIIAGILSGREILLMVETGIALAIATVPEGLPVVATLALARGVYRMAKRSALVNRLSAVETLGTTGVIYTDKTGTLTENRMTVTLIALESGEVEVSGFKTKGKFTINGEVVDARKDEVLSQLLKVCVLCNNSSLQAKSDGTIEVTGDPLEVALMIAGYKAGFEKDKLLEELPEVREDAFDPHVKMMATFHKKDGRYLVAVKGAPENVLDASDSLLDQAGEEKELSSEKRGEWLERTVKMARTGLRAIAFASKLVDSDQVDPFKGLTFLGVCGLLDPPRENIAEAIKLSKEAGIEVVMVTGDHPETAKNIALKIGLVDDENAEVILGKEILDLKDLSEDQKNRLLNASVLARVSPEQKLNLVSLQQERGTIVAMTGDGVNDAPALKKADIGIAMGVRGTEVAREAADMVLKDDNFCSIVSAVEAGRVIFDNIRNFVLYLLSCNIGEVMIIAVASLLTDTLPLLPLQILFLNVVTDVFPALALGVGEGDSSIMRRPPRHPAEAILTRDHWRSMIVYGAIMAASVLTAFALSLFLFKFDEPTSVTVAFLTLAFAQLVHVFNMREVGSNLIRNEVTRNRFIWLALGLCTGLIMLTVYLPPLAEVLSLKSPNLVGWGMVIAFSLLVGMLGQLMIEIRKRIGNVRTQK